MPRRRESRILRVGEVVLEVQARGEGGDGHQNTPLPYWLHRYFALGDGFHHNKAFLVLPSSLPRPLVVILAALSRADEATDIVLNLGTRRDLGNGGVIQARGEVVLP